MENLEIWRLAEGGKYLSFIPHDLRYFSDKFNCKSHASNWEIPIAKIAGRSLPVADFVSWVHKAPIVSLRARSLIENLAGNDVEFLEFHQIKQKSYFVMNVLRCEPLIEFKKSDFTPIKEKYYFKIDLNKNLPPIFKCVGVYEQIFVTRSFAEMIVANQLKGAILADPSEVAMPLLISGKSINRYSGLLT